MKFISDGNTRINIELMLGYYKTQDGKVIVSFHEEDSMIFDTDIDTFEEALDTFLQSTYMVFELNKFKRCE